MKNNNTVNTATIQIDIYSKPGCHLCEEAKEVIEQVKTDYNLEVWEINIEENEELFRRYRYDIPVVMINGSKAFKHRVDPEKLRKRLLKEQ